METVFKFLLSKPILSFFQKNFPKWFPGKMSIMVCIKTSELSKYTPHYKKAFFEEISNVIEKMGLSNAVTIKDFSDKFNLENQDDVKSYLKDKDINLMIWGKFSQADLKSNNEYVHDLTINYTLNVDLKLKSTEIVAIDNQKYFQKAIHEGNARDDILDISIKTSTIALYIVAIIMKYCGEYQKSENILEELYLAHLQNRTDFLQGIKTQLLHCYQLHQLTVATDIKDYEEGVKIAEKIMKIDPHNHFALLQISYCSYRAGNIANARKYVKEMCLYHFDRFSTKINCAFFFLYDGKYTEAMNIYDSLLNLEMDVSLSYIIESLDYEFKRTKDPAFLYASGLLSYYLGDKVLAKKDINTFLNLAEHKHRRLVRSINEKIF